MKFLGLSLLASLALAAPMQQSQITKRGGQQTCDNPGRVVSIVLDASGSTATSDPKKLRVAGSKDLLDYMTSASEATATNKADTVSIVKFSLYADLLYKQGDVNDAARQALDRVEPGGGTSIADGLEAGISQVLASNPGERGGLVVWTDGQDPSTDKILAQIKRAKDAKIRVSWAHTNTEDRSKSGGFLSGLINGMTDLITGPLKAMSGTKDEFNQQISAAALDTGGTVSIIKTVAAQKEFVQQVIKNGITNNDGKCSGNDVGQSGGPLINDVTTLGLCSKNAEAVFTYSPKSQHETLGFAVQLTSTNSPVNIQATYTNKATGQTSTVTVNKGSPAGALKGEANPGEQVEVRIVTSNADNNSCQYSVTLKTQAGGPVVPVPSSSPAPVPSSSPAPVPSSQAPSPSAPAPSSQAPSPSAPAPSSQAPSPSAPAPSSATECPPAPSASTITNTVTQTQTVTGPAPSSTVCICKCDAPGAKPMPKFEL